MSKHIVAIATVMTYNNGTCINPKYPDFHGIMVDNMVGLSAWADSRSTKKETEAMLYALIVLGLTALDQLVKFLVRANIPLGGNVPFLPGIMDLTYYQNTGAAFSLFSEHTWVLSLVSAVVSVAIVVLLVKKVFPQRPAMLILSIVLAGAVGNLIDRALLGYVTDMFMTTFINFAIFNVADICLTVGGVAFCVYYILFSEREEKGKEPRDDTPSADR